METGHEPVMVSEVLALLLPSRGGTFVDCTVGLGGHARAVLDAGASRLIGLDRDPEAVTRARAALDGFGSRIEVVHADYRRMGDVLDARQVTRVEGVLVDLGVSSMQLDAEGRGFSFQRDEALDMRMDTSAGSTAAEMLAAADERTLADVIYEFGEERYARRIARAIVQARASAPIESTGRLAEITRRAVPRRGGYARIDPATRTFQAIRIWVNQELDGLDHFLREAARRLAAGGRIAVLSFHSLEDRIVKHTFRALQAELPPIVRVLTKRPVLPTEAEIARNPRARSAKLRGAEAA